MMIAAAAMNRQKQRAVEFDDGLCLLRAYGYQLISYDQKNGLGISGK